MTVVSVLLKLMGHLHQCMRRQVQLFLFNRFVILVGFATAFRAAFCHRLKNFEANCFLNPDSQSPLALISCLGSSSFVVHLKAKVSPFSS